MPKDQPQFPERISEAEHAVMEVLGDRLFGGRAAPLFAHLAENEALTDQDLAEIETLLKELRK